ncbi:FkbM family methyltransferase [Nocardia abscessus]|uniref:FkbM family methyltransferase n=1 Tax=Nocardia abscessus TaxID=120957 RepID=UPI0024555DD8|nr:FkbM family methyltransferase [Nocardia abscessus]
MIVLTPNPRYRFTTRDGSPSDEAVIRETWVENVYQIHAGDLAREGAVCVDIGANIGAVAVYAASLGGVRVLAAEPEPDNLKYLRQNIDDNGVAEKVHICEAAVSGHRGVGYIVEGHGHSVLHPDPQPNSVEVPVLTLADLFDQYEIGECDVLKVDIEGAEYPLMAGADLDTLRRVRYLTLEFDAAPDELFGPLVAKLAKTHGIQILGSPERGGYIYARRY